MAFQNVLVHRVSRDLRTLLSRWPPSGQGARLSRCPDQLACPVKAQASVNVADTGLLPGALAGLDLAGDEDQRGNAETGADAPGIPCG